MKFISTRRASPVIHGNDKPWQYDLFHHLPEEVPENSKAYKEYLIDNNIVIDVEWWNEQKRRCEQGIDIPNAIEKGGNAYVDEVDVFWNDSLIADRYLDEYDYLIPPNSCYIPSHKLLIENKTIHITGRHYFYLNFWPIFRNRDDVARKDILPPKFIDIDFFFFRRMEIMVELVKDDLEMKGRQVGISEKFALMLGFNFTFFKASVNIVVGGESADADHTMENTQRGLKYLINTQFYKERDKSTSDFWRAKYFRSEIRSISAKDNAQAVSRFSPTLLICEEIGKWKKGLLKELKQFVDVSTQAENKKTGYIILGGTGGDMEAGAADAEDMAYNPETVNVLEFKNIFDKDNTVFSKTCHFISSMYFRVIDNDGNSDVVLGKKAVLEERAKLKGKDKYTHTTQRALYLGDAFMVNTGGYFGEEVAMWCNERMSFIRTHESEQVIERGWLRWKNRSNKWEGVYFEPDEDGPFKIYEHPQVDIDNKVYHNLYVTSTDSYDQDESYTTTSQGACGVKKRFLNSDSIYNTIVALIVERPETSVGGKDVFYEYTALLTMYYNSKNLIEWSKILIFEWYARNGLESLLKERPEFVLSKMINKTQTTNYYGIDPSTKPSWLKLMADYLKVKENIDKCYFPELLKAWATFKYIPGNSSGKYNCDRTIMTSLLETYEEDIREMEVMSDSEIDNDVALPTYKVSDSGELVMSL